MSTVPFAIPAYPKPLSISQARRDLPPEEFRQRLRSHLLDHPGLTLAQVAREIKVTRQCVGQMVGKLNRPNVASPLFMRLAPKTDEARKKMVELKRLVAAGESAERAAAQLGVSLPAAIKAGFRTRAVRSAHGTRERAAHCGCWRCRRAVGVALRRRPKSGSAKRIEVLDWCAWTDPQDGSRLTQQEIAQLSGISQGAVSRISRGGDQ